MQKSIAKYCKHSSYPQEQDKIPYGLKNDVRNVKTKEEQESQKSKVTTG